MSSCGASSCRGNHFQWCQLQQRLEVTSYSYMKTLLCHTWVWETFKHYQSFVCPSDNFMTQWLFKNILEPPSEKICESLLPVFVRQMTSLQSSWPPQDASNSSSYEKSSPWIFTCIKPILWILEKCVTCDRMLANIEAFMQHRRVSSIPVST